jgi:Arc/MetJ-type ribon-helix-helix transcriptional regulator
MSKKMTIVFHDEELYTDLKIEAVRRHRSASDIVAEAVKEWLETKESEELVPLLEEAIAEAEEKGYRSWNEVEKELKSTISEEKLPISVAEKKNVRH